MSLLSRLYEALTGRPYYTTRTASVEYGRTPGDEIAAVFGDVPDEVLLAHGLELLREARRLVDESNRRDAVRRNVRSRRFERGNPNRSAKGAKGAPLGSLHPSHSSALPSGKAARVAQNDGYRGSRPEVAQ